MSMEPTICFPKAFLQKGVPENTIEQECQRTALLTEAEWEYCARGGEDHPYAGSDDLDEVGWYDKNSGNESLSRGEKNPMALVSMT